MAPKDLVNGRKLNEYENQRYEKIISLEKENYEVYGRKWSRNFNSKTLKEKFNGFSKEELLILNEKNPPSIIIAGRLMQSRIMGKSIFATLQDEFGQFQIYLTVNINAPLVEWFSQFADLGDIFGIVGHIMKTKTGELTISVKEMVMLSKALRMLPDKYHGLSDIEERYRRRYVDLIVNPQSKEIFVKRNQIFNALREFLNARDYLEVETPVLQEVSGGANAKPFITHHNTLKSDFYLRIATELHLKRLIVGGFEKVYEIGRLFRNEGMSPKHNPEFTTIEVYVAYEDMRFMMNLTEEVIKYIIQKVNGALLLSYEGHELDFCVPWTKKTMIQSIMDITGYDFSPLVITYSTINDKALYQQLKNKAYIEAKKIADKFDVFLDKHQNTVGHIINAFFEKFVEKTLIQPTFIYDYPVEISPLSKLLPNSKDFVDRFELFVVGREYANAYSELNDPIEQYQRFLEQQNQKELGDEEANEMDIDFVEALEYGMPPTAGLGIGMDRLVMLITGANSIKDVLLFPQLKPRTKN